MFVQKNNQMRDPNKLYPKSSDNREVQGLFAGKTQSRCVAELKAGTTFGENPIRTASVLARGSYEKRQPVQIRITFLCPFGANIKEFFSGAGFCELLTVDRVELQNLLAENADFCRENRLKNLHYIPALAEWDEDELEALNLHCRTFDFPRNHVSA